MPPALRIATAPVSRSDEAACPVATLASEAAALVRALYALTDPDFYDAPPPSPVPDLTDIRGENGSYDHCEVRNEIMHRLRAIQKIAVIRTAKSMKGALFQLYLTADTSVHIEAELLTGIIPGTELDKIHDMQRRTDRLLYSACSVIENFSDDDLPWLRAHYYPDRDRPSHMLANVIDELKARTA